MKLRGSESLTSGCPCHCNAPGDKLTKFGHVRGCYCRSCMGRRNRASGQRAQRLMHRALGGVGNTPTNEEWGRPYTLNVQVEVKSGEQIPASFAKAFGTDWFRRAISQAERAIPIGVDAKPAVALKFPDSTQTWLVVKG